MNVKLKKFSLKKPNVNITTGLRTIARKTIINNIPAAAKMVCNFTPIGVIAVAEMEE